MSNEPRCPHGISRRRFCGATGVGLIALGLGGCDPGQGRVSVGGLDDSSGDTSSNVGGGGPEPDAGSGDTDMAHGGGPTDMAHASPDMAKTGGTCATGLLDCGAASAIVVGQPKRFTDNVRYDLYVCRDANGWYALDSACTHSGCPVQVKSGKFWCNCHGATFDFNGGSPTLPAYQPLPHYAVCIDSNGTLYVDYNKTVSASTRA